MKDLSLTDSYNINRELENFLPGALQYNFNFPWETEPIHFKDGKGHFLKDVDGNTYLDFFSKFGASILGHKNTIYADSLSTEIQNKLSTVDHVGEDEVVIIKKFLSFIPGGEQVRFSLSGTEAVQNALRLSRAFTGRNKIIRFTGHYHGSMDNMLGGFSKDGGWYVPQEMQNDQRGTKGRAEHAFSDSLLLPWNDIAAFKRVVEHYKNEIAAIDFVYKYADGKNFKVYTYLPSVYDYPYQYLFWWYGQKKYGYIPGEYVYSPNKPTYIPSQDKFQGRKDNFSGLVFLIKEPNRGYNWRSGWEASYRFMKLLSSVKIGLLDVEVRQENGN